MLYLLFLLAGAAEAVFHTGKLRHYRRYLVFKDIFRNLIWFGHFLVHLGAYPHGAFAVKTLDTQRCFAQFNLRHRMERHAPSIRRPDAHIVQVAHGISFISRETHHHLDFVLTTLHALDFLPIKAGAHLARQVGQGQAQ